LAGVGKRGGKQPRGDYNIQNEKNNQKKAGGTKRLLPATTRRTYWVRKRMTKKAEKSATGPKKKIRIKKRQKKTESLLRGNRPESGGTKEITRHQGK